MRIARAESRFACTASSASPALSCNFSASRRRIELLRCLRHADSENDRERLASFSGRYAGYCAPHRSAMTTRGRTRRPEPRRRRGCDVTGQGLRHELPFRHVGPVLVQSTRHDRKCGHHACICKQRVCGFPHLPDRADLFQRRRDGPIHRDARISELRRREFVGRTRLDGSRGRRREFIHVPERSAIERDIGHASADRHRRIRSAGGHHIDTVLVPSQQTTTIKVRQSSPGKRMFHCHILQHEDNCMMAILDVQPYGSA